MRSKPGALEQAARCATVAVPGGFGLHFWGIGGAVAGSLLGELVVLAIATAWRRRDRGRVEPGLAQHDLKEAA